MKKILVLLALGMVIPLGAMEKKEKKEPKFIEKILCKEDVPKGFVMLKNGKTEFKIPLHVAMLSKRWALMIQGAQEKGPVLLLSKELKETGSVVWDVTEWEL